MTNPTPVSQTSAGPASGEGRAAFARGRTIEQTLAQSHYANRASMVAGAYHVARGYADAAEAAGHDRAFVARVIGAGNAYQRVR
jgi:hypothetical protein